MIRSRSFEGSCLALTLSLILLAGCEVGRDGTGVADEQTILPINNRDYYSSVHAALGHAEESIHVIMYVMKYYPEEPSSVNLLLDDLIEAHSSGVDVKIVVEGAATVVDTSMVNYLKENGISVNLDPEGVTTHAKLIVLDGEAVILGSTNWSESALGNNNETSVEIKDQSIAGIYEDYFQSIWEVSGDD